MCKDRAGGADAAATRDVMRDVGVSPCGICQGSGMKSNTGSQLKNFAETLGINVLYPHVRVCRSFSESFELTSSATFHPRTLTYCPNFVSRFRVFTPKSRPNFANFSRKSPPKLRPNFANFSALFCFHVNDGM